MEPTPKRPRITVTTSRFGLTSKSWTRADLAAFGAELEALTGEPWLWSPHTWRGNLRARDNWEAASCIALDLDYAPDFETNARTGDWRPTHATVPDDVRAQLDDALRALPPELAAGEVLAHHTPRGARLVLMLAAPITDRDLFWRAGEAAGALVSTWLDAAGLLAGSQGSMGLTWRPGFVVDPSALTDLARVYWAPNATKVDPQTGAREVRAASFVYRGTLGVPFDAAQLVEAVAAPKRLMAARMKARIQLARATDDRPPHPRWAAIHAALSTTPQATPRPDRVGVLCPFHEDKSPSAVVFASGLLHCSSCARSWRLDEWARDRGASALLGDELTRALVSGTTDDARPARLDELWRTVADRQADARWFTDEPPARRWLLTVAPDDEDQTERFILPMGKVGMLAAGGGVGKTMALVQLALAVSTGRPWLATASGSGGFQTPPGGGRVLLALGEEDELEVRRRLFRAAELMRRAGDRHVEADLRKAAERIVVLPLAGRDVSLVDGPNARIGKLSSSSSQTAGDLARLLEEDGQRRGDWALVVVDPLSRFAGIDSEKDNAAATRFIQELERFTEAPGTPAVLVAHHSSQNGRTKDGDADDTDARGVTALSDGVRWHAALTKRDADDVRLATLAVVKSNYGAFLRRPMWLARGPYGELTQATRADRERFDRALTTRAAERATATKQTHTERASTTRLPRLPE